MYRLNLAQYDVIVDVKGDDGQLATGTRPVAVRQSLVGILFAEPGLTADEAIERAGIARKIRDANDGDVVTFTDAEFNKLKSVVEAFRGYTFETVGIVERVRAAERTES